jgi:hypothetical protein
MKTEIFNLLPPPSPQSQQPTSTALTFPNMILHVYSRVFLSILKLTQISIDETNTLLLSYTVQYVQEDLPAEDSPSTFVKKKRFGEWVPFCSLPRSFRLFTGGQSHLPNYSYIFSTRSSPVTEYTW